jgi:hypothetical protein
LKLEAGEPNDLRLVTAVPNWHVDESFVLGNGERLRILAIETEISRGSLSTRGSTPCSPSNRPKYVWGSLTV